MRRLKDRTDRIDRIESERESERGSALPLVPALFLICIFLGILAVDTASIFLAQRELLNATAAAANDAASEIEGPEYFNVANYKILQQRAELVANKSITDRLDDTFRGPKATASISGNFVVISTDATITPLFRSILPKSMQRITLRVKARAAADKGEP
jgi:uncharacterized membrane protein